MQTDGDRHAQEAAERVARRSYGRLVAYLAARTGDVAGAEDALAEAFATALQEWPKTGVPGKPEAWLLTVARRKRLDTWRHQARADGEGQSHLLLLAEEAAAATDKDIPDERLGLMFACAHPDIDVSMHAPLMLQTILGLDAAAIASAFLVEPKTMGQRLVRAKARIKSLRIPFEVPDKSELAERLDSVLAAIYAIFSEGWNDAAGTDLRVRNHTSEGLWLGRLVVSILPDEAEALGLLALMLYAEARQAARRDQHGAFVPLSQQDISLWDKARIHEAEDLLQRASALGVIGRYQLEAAIQSAHVARVMTGCENWTAIEQLYDGLIILTGSPVVAINRAIIVAETTGAAAALALLDKLGEDRRLLEYQPYWAARAELLVREGRHVEAADAYRRAMGLESDPAVRNYLLQKRDALKN